MTRTLDWHPRFDERSRAFALAETPKALRNAKWRNGPILDQGPDGACVGFAATANLASTRGQLTFPDGNAVANALYRFAQQVDEWEGECVDYQTYCLTRTGWKNGEDLTLGEDILTFDIETEQTVWAPVINIHTFDEPAPVVEMKHNGFSAVVTSNHRWPVRPRTNGNPRAMRKFTMRRTDSLTASDEIIRAAEHQNYPGASTYSDDFVEMVAWVACEGYYRPTTRRGSGVVVSQKTHRDRVAALVQRLGGPAGSFNPTTQQHTWELSGPLSLAIREVAPGRAPTIEWLTSLTKTQLDLFLDTCVLADGTTSVPTRGNRQSHSVFFQKTGPILDSWLAAMALAGRPTSRARNGGVEAWTMRRSNSIDTRAIKMEEAGVVPVWCPETEKGTFIARRGGSVFITGNSYSGTSVLAGMKALKRHGYISRYEWCFGLYDVLHALAWRGPVQIGVWWHEGMLEPDSDGLIHPAGLKVGGHSVLVSGIDFDEKQVIITNSWGAGWGTDGQARMQFNDLGKLLDDNGEAVVISKVKSSSK